MLPKSWRLIAGLAVGFWFVFLVEFALLRLHSAVPLTLVVSPAHGYDPLEVTLDIRVAIPTVDTTLCSQVDGSPLDRLSCQPLTRASHYIVRFILPAGNYEVSAFLEPSLQHTPVHPVQVLANVADPH